MPSPVTQKNDLLADNYGGGIKHWGNIPISLNDWVQDVATEGTFLSAQGTAGQTKYDAVSFTGSTTISQHLTTIIPQDYGGELYMDCVFVTAATASAGSAVFDHRADTVDVGGQNTTGEAFDAAGTLGTATQLVPANYATRPCELILPIYSTLGDANIQPGDVLTVKLRRRAYGPGARSNDNRMNMVAAKLRYKKSVDNDRDADLYKTATSNVAV